VPCAGEPSPLPDEAQAEGPPSSGATRSVPAACVPGEPVTILIAATPDSNVHAYAVEDALPAGWTVSACSHDGEFDPASRKVKWGPFLDRTARTLSYQATPPAVGAGVAYFKGTTSFDGASLAIAGPSQLSASGRVVLRRQSGGMVLSLAGREEARFVIETSSNLVDWTPVANVTLTGGSAIVPLPSNASEPQRFYRAVVVEQ
jgi:hypothetical protein